VTTEGQPSRSSAAVGLIYGLTAVGSLLWLGGIFLAPYLRSHSSPGQGLIYFLYSPFCHQIPARCFHVFGAPLAVCARCAGIYSGFFVGVGLYPLWRGFHRVELPASKVFILMSLPIVLDSAGNFLRLWQTSNWVRLATGILWGVILPLYLITGLADLVTSRRK
jgi:uncharacterized membrane protein